MKKSSKYFIIILFFMLSSKLISAETDKAQIFAAYINNFVKYTTWTNENQLDSFRIVVITKNKEIEQEFIKFASNRKIKTNQLV